MDYQRYLNNLFSAKQRTTVLLGVIIALLIFLLLSIGLNYRLANRVAVRLVPMQLTQPVTVSTTAVDANYLSMMAVSVASLKLNVTPHTAKQQFKLLSVFIAPADYAQLNAVLLHDVKTIKSAGLTSSFAINSIRVNTQTLTVVLTGLLSRFEGGLALTPLLTHIDIAFINRNGVLQLTQLSEVKA